MKVYKFLEQEPKIFGLRFRDWIFIIAFGGGLIFAKELLLIAGIDLGFYGLLVIVLFIAISIYLLKKANKEKCPNYLDAWLSYKLYQVRYINPKAKILKKKSK